MIEPGNPVQGAIVGLTRELSDPVRLTALQLLAAEGPHTMVQLADALGVAVFAVLFDGGALRPPDGSAAGLTLGRDASAFHDLGVDPATVDPGRRRLATACLDRTNRVPHLGGVLGHEVLEAFLAAGW